MARKAVWFVRRAIDDRMLCVDGKWRNMVSADRIKFYSSCGRATRYGLRGVKGKPMPGNTEEIGTVIAVYPDQSVNAVGQIFDSDGNCIRK